MSKLTYGRTKRISAEFRGDEAIDIELLEVKLRLGEVARTRFEADTHLIRLALQALVRSMEDYCEQTGARYPSYRVLRGFLAGEAEAIPAADDTANPRIVNLAK